jgi:flagellar export protein FliJ
MKKFRFSLAPVRTVRQRQEQVALEQYARAVRAWQLAQSALADVQLQREAAWQLRRDRALAGATAADLAQAQDYGAALETLEKRCAEAVVAALAVVDQKLNELHGARRARKTVDKFLDRQRERYDRELQREEQKTLDDLARRRRPRTTLAGTDIR